MQTSLPRPRAQVTGPRAQVKGRDHLRKGRMAQVGGERLEQDGLGAFKALRQGRQTGQHLIQQDCCLDGGRNPLGKRVGSTWLR